MPERDGAEPQDEPNGRRGDLFSNLPHPSTAKVKPADAPPVVSSRRAAREQASSPAPATATASADFGGLEELLAPAANGKGDAPKRPKKSRKGCLVALVIVLVLFGGAAAGGLWVYNTYSEQINDLFGWGEPKDFEDGIATGETFIIISENDTGRPISSSLFAAGVTKTDSVFYDMLIEDKVNATFFPGVYKLQKQMSAAAALAALKDPANKLENSVAVAEGGTVAKTLPMIAEVTQIPLVDLETAVLDPTAYGVNAQTLEGWLFPAVYTFDPDVTATKVIQRMVDRTRESLAAADVPEADAQRILTIASIIQREGRTDDFAKVSRVIQNRLDDGMMLQMDSTAQYGYGELHEGSVSTSADAQFDDNAWNTYVIPGLPVGPIANPGDAAIFAAMHPEDGPWFYFVTIDLYTGETQFSTTYEEHEQGIKKWRAWCTENPDAGC